MKNFEGFSQNMENLTENLEIEPREVYINEVLAETKNKLEKYFPIFYRDIPTEVQYKDNSEELKINQNFDFESGKLKINMQTMEDLTGKNVSELKKQRASFLVFKGVSEKETVLKKTQDFFFLVHEYGHGINSALFRECRPDMVEKGEKSRSDLAKVDESFKKEIQKEESSGIVSVLGESWATSLERMMTEQILQDSVDQGEKDSVKNFWELHEKAMLSRRLEKDPLSQYSGLDEGMIFYKIYERFGEKGIMDFIKNFDFDKISKIKTYSDLENKILSEEYKKFLDMTADEIVENFAKKNV